MFLKRFVLFFVLISALNCSAQNTVLKNFTTNDGLPSSQIYDVIEDQYGFLWFSTDKGLSRYDGYAFKNYSVEDGLPDNVVFDFHKSSDGKIWCTTNSTKLFTIQGRVPIFKNYQYNDTIKKYAGNLITNGLYIDDKDAVFISFHHVLGYLKISGDGKVIENVKRPKSSVPAILDIKVVVDDRKEPFFFYSDDDAPLRYSQLTTRSFHGVIAKSKSEAIHFKKQSTSVFLANKEIIIQGNNNDTVISHGKVVISSGKLDENSFWVGLRYGGVKIFSLNGDIQDSILSDASVTQLYKDSQGNLWVTTLTKGAYCISNTPVKFIQNTTGTPVSSLSAGLTDEIYVGFYNGNIDIVNSKGAQKHFYTPLKNQPATIYFHAPSKTHYFGSDILFSSDGSIRLPWTCSAIGSLKGNYLLAGSTGLYALNLTNRELASTQFFEDKRIKDVIELNNTLYAATLDGVFYTKTFKTVNSYDQLIPNIRVDDLAILGRDLVIGTYGNGILILDRNHKIIHTISTKNGLSSNFISNIFVENDSTLWISTNNGLNQVTIHGQDNYAIIRYNTSNGLLSNEVWASLVHNNVVWIGTQNGLSYFTRDYSEVQPARHISYHLQWTSLKMRDVNIEGQNVFQHDENNFEFNFLAIRLNGGEKLVYRYKLVGLSDQWHETRNCTVSFSSLPAGKYTLIVQVKEEDGKWSKERIYYSFNITPPYWTTPWFITLCLIVVIGLLYLFFKIKILTYNKDIVREILRFVLKKVRRHTPSVLIKHNGRTVQLQTENIHYFKTSGNYIEIKTIDSTYLVRSSIANFMSKLPDSIEFIQIHRSFVVRIDKIQQIGPRNVTVLDEEIPIGRKYNKNIKLINSAVK